MLSRLERILPYLVPLLVLGIGLWQQYASHWLDLTPWKGGGFGMFSTVDSLKLRKIRAFGRTPQGWVALEMPEKLARAEEFARALPTQGNLLGLARQLGQRDWWVEEPATQTLMPVASSKEPQDHNLQPLKLQTVRVELWRGRFNQQASALYLKPTRSADWVVH